MSKIIVKDIELQGLEFFTDSENFMDALKEDCIKQVYGGGASPIDLDTNLIFIPCPNPTRPVPYPLPCTPLVL